MPPTRPPSVLFEISWESGWGGSSTQHFPVVWKNQRRLTSLKMCMCVAVKICVSNFENARSCQLRWWKKIEYLKTMKLTETFESLTNHSNNQMQIREFANVWFKTCPWNSPWNAHWNPMWPLMYLKVMLRFVSVNWNFWPKPPIFST